MQVINQVVPSDSSQLEAAAKQGPKGPVFMVNLLKFKDKAEYADGRETNLTGREAYNLYGAGVAGLLPEFGARFFFMSNLTHVALGQVEELWDELAIAVYPDRNALFRMSQSEEWQDLAVHRTAGLAGQINLESVMPEMLKGLPWMALFLKEFE